MLSYRAVVVFVAAIGFATPAFAAPTGTVAVLGIEPIEVPDALAQQLTDALRKGVRNVTGWRQVQGKDLIEMKMVFGCENEPPCLAQAGRSLGAERLVIGSLKKSIRPTHMDVRLRLIDVRKRIHIGEVDVVVSRADVGANADAWLAQLFGVTAPEAPRAPTSLYVASVPSGAEVLVDGAPAGKTPLDLTTIAPGKHALRITIAGYAPIDTVVDVLAEKRTPLELRLTRTTPIAVAPPVPASNDPIPGYLSQKPIPGVRTARAVMGVGVAALVLGVVLGGVSIYTWYSYTNLENDLTDRVPLFVPNRPATAAEATWLTKPNCSPPSSLAEFGNTAGFASDCKHGRSLANTTSGLVAAATIVGVAGLASIIAGWQLEQKARKRADRTTFLLVPALSPTYLGMGASGTF